MGTFRRANIYLSLVLIVTFVVASSSFGLGSDDADLREIATKASLKFGIDFNKMNEIVHLFDRASKPSKRPSITSGDLNKLDTWTRDPESEVRSWAYGALASLRQTAFRERAIKIIARLKTDPNLSLRRGYFVKAWSLDAPDWKAAATEALSDPDEAEIARQLLARGSPKP